MQELTAEATEAPGDLSRRYLFGVIAPSTKTNPTGMGPSIRRYALVSSKLRGGSPQLELRRLSMKSVPAQSKWWEERYALTDQVSVLHEVAKLADHPERDNGVVRGVTGVFFAFNAGVNPRCFVQNMQDLEWKIAESLLLGQLTDALSATSPHADDHQSTFLDVRELRDTITFRRLVHLLQVAVVGAPHWEAALIATHTSTPLGVPHSEFSIVRNDSCPVSTDLIIRAAVATLKNFDSQTFRGGQ